jgi:hypothetical protein
MGQNCSHRAITDGHAAHYPAPARVGGPPVPGDPAFSGNPGYAATIPCSHAWNIRNAAVRLPPSG